MSPRQLPIIALCASLISCGAPEGKADAPPTEGEGAEAGSGAAPEAQATPQAADAPSGPITHDLSDKVSAAQELEIVASMSWGAGDVLRLGYEDAQLGVMTLGSKQLTLKKLEAEPSRLIYVSPEGQLALLDAKPPRLIRVADSREVLRMNHVPTHIEAAGWHPSGSAFFATEPTGKIHLWKASEEQLRRLPDETIQMFLNRQLPDYTGHLPEMAGPFVVRPDGLILFGDVEGHTLRWSPQKPTDVELIIKLDGPVASMTSQGELMAATSRAGQLRVADLSKNAFVPWSMKAQARYVAAHHEGELLFVARDGEISAIKPADGAPVWSAKVGQASSCGLSVSRDGKRLAACFAGRVLILNASDGSFVSQLGRHKDELRWL